MAAMVAVVHRSSVPLEDWRRLEVPEGWRAELIGGEIVVTPAPSTGHSIIATRLAEALRPGVPDGHVVTAHPVEWEIGGGRRLSGAPQPDVVVVEDVDVQRLTAPPMLAAEVLSASDRRPLERSELTRIEAKRRDYADGGLRDYLELDLADGLAVLRRYELDEHTGQLVVVSVATGDEPLSAERPFSYTVRPSELLPRR